jgi:hypothetical protein
MERWKWIIGLMGLGAVVFLSPECEGVGMLWLVSARYLPPGLPAEVAAPLIQAAERVAALKPMRSTIYDLNCT